MALFKAVVWALIFLTKLRFPPGVSIAIVLKYLSLVSSLEGYINAMAHEQINVLMRSCERLTMYS